MPSAFLRQNQPKDKWFALNDNVRSEESHNSATYYGLSLKLALDTLHLMLLLLPLPNPAAQSASVFSVGEMR